MSRQSKSVRPGTISGGDPSENKSRRDEKREAILAAAKDLFFAHGYSGVSMDEIVARVGGSKATLYSHFASKDDLLLALADYVVADHVARAMKTHPEQDFPAFLREFGRIAMAGRTSPDIVGMERLAASEALRFPDFGHAYFEQAILPARQRVSTLFKSAMEAGALRPMDPMLATDQFMEMCCGWLWRRQIWGIAPRPTSAEIAANVDAAAKAFLQGYALHKGSAANKERSLPPTRASESPLPSANPKTNVAQPARTRRDLKRQAIIEAAEELFFAEGYANVSMNRIVERVGGSKATLYSHFPSKQDLLFAVVQDVESGQSLDVPSNDRDATQSADGFRDWLRAFGRLAVARLTSHKFISLQRLAAGEATQLPEVGRIFFEAGVVPAFSQFVGFFAEAMANGVLRKAAPETAAEHFVEMCTGGAMRQVIWGIRPPPTEAEVGDQIDAAVQTFMDGVALR